MESGPSSSIPLPALTPAILGSLKVFAGLDEASLELLADRLTVRRFETGEYVIREGETARELYAVLAGELEVLKQGREGTEDGAHVRLALLGPSDNVGEMSMIEMRPRSASARALAPSFLVGLSAAEAEELLYRRDVKQYALLVMNIARELSRRVRVADGLVAQYVAKYEEATEAHKHCD